MSKERMWTSKTRAVLGTCLVVASCGCSAAGSDPGAEEDGSGKTTRRDDPEDDQDTSMGGAAPDGESGEVKEREKTDPPPPLALDEDAELCILSADCPYGSHCDLGECVQDCNTESLCDDGLFCSARARCLKDDEEDVDPAPLTVKLGDVAVDPTATVLSEDEDRLLIRLTSTSKDEVGYRIVTSAPYLSVSEPRGVFEGETVVEVDVDSDGLEGRHMAGTLRILTTLGELTVDAPIRVGMTGAYEGSFKYFAGDVPLGQARLALDLLEENGDVQVRVDREQSLLFPSAGEDTFGRGIYTVGTNGGVEFRISHVLPAQAGGERNRFGRDIGRELIVSVQPGARGVLEGTFEERIHGLFEQAVTLHGTVQLRRRPKEIVEHFELPPKLVMPSNPKSTRVNGRYVVAYGVEAATGDDSCLTLAAIPIEPVPREEEWLACISDAQDYYYAPFLSAFNGNRSTSAPLSNLSNTCEKAMTFDAEAMARIVVDTQDFAQFQSEHRCTSPAGFAGVLEQLERSYSASNSESSRLFHQAVARLLAGPLFVAQELLVESVRASFVDGVQSQRERLLSARRVLNRAAALVLQPKYLEFLKNSDRGGAAGRTSGSDATTMDYPGLRALSRLMFVTSVIDEELSALSATDEIRTREDLLLEAQQGAVLTLFEAATVSGIVKAWGGNVPAGVGNEMVGALTPTDSGFKVLLHGATLFGVPSGEIPLSFDPARPQPTNFEQMLASADVSALSQQNSDETAFLNNLRNFETNEELLAKELEGLRTGLEETIQSICGTTFDPDAIVSDADWDMCGAEGTGSVWMARTNVELRHAEALSAQTRLEGLGEKILIDRDTLSETQAARGKTLSFVDKTNSEINARTEVQNILSAAVKALELASNASAMNGGASVGMGVAAGILEHQQRNMELQKDKLRQAQQMRQMEETKEIEFLTGMANIQKQLIDAHQLEIDLEQSAIGITQATIALANEMERVQRAVLERQRVLTRISNSSVSDPMVRTLVSQAAVRALGSRRSAQKWIYRAGRALEYEVNTPLGESLGRAVLAAYNTDEMEALTTCYRSIFAEYRQAVGVPQEFSTTVSVREMLGVTGKRVDDVTGEVLSEGELFRRILLQNENLDGAGGVGLEFSTNLEPGNDLWSSNVCDDKIVSVRAQIVGDFQGDDEAEIKLKMAGGGVVRRCDTEHLVNWSIDSKDIAIVQAGVNGFGAASANTTLHGHSVARPNWTIEIPGGDTAPSNRDLKLDAIEDVVLEIKHVALPQQNQSIALPLSCLSKIGGGI